MSAEDYKQIEKLFCGTWKEVRLANMETFTTEAGMSEEVKNFMRQKRALNFTRVGNAIHQKIIVGDKEYEIPKHLNEEREWKDKEENPIVHTKEITSFKDGVVHQEIIPLIEGGGKKYVLSAYIQGEELIVAYRLPDVPGVTAQRVYQRC